MDSQECGLELGEVREGGLQSASLGDKPVASAQASVVSAPKLWTQLEASIIKKEHQTY